MKLGGFTFTLYRISKFVLEKKLRLIENARKWPKEWVHVLLLQPFLLFQSLYPPILNRPFIWSRWNQNVALSHPLMCRAPPPQKWPSRYKRCAMQWAKKNDCKRDGIKLFSFLATVQSMGLKNKINLTRPSPENIFFLTTVLLWWTCRRKTIVSSYNTCRQRFFL